MKKPHFTFLFAVAVVLLTLLSACHGKTSLTGIEEEQSHYTAQELVKELKPVSISRQSNGDVQLSFQVAEGLLSLKELQAAKDDVIYAMLEKLHTTTDTTLQNVLKYCQKQQKQVVCHYEGETSKDVFDLVLPNSELNE
ncbi:MAG: hypothetical protein J6S65_01055 [Bacteroidaceae bacterium]|nr:hypothetical protein [Bacteroidaceae bacterium]